MDRDLLQWRMGYGPRAGQSAPEPAAALAEIAAPSPYPYLAQGAGQALLTRFAPAKRAERDKVAGDMLKQVKAEINQLVEQSLRVRMARAVAAPAGLRERMMAFWCDHFTTRGRRLRDHPLVLEHHEQAIAPHLAGRFADLLVAAETHPAMLVYLDQNRSIGPNSARAKKRPERGLGLNENLAREVMELHTLGAGGPYTQADVRELAELFTGMTHSESGGVSFDPKLAEPGAEMVLGQRFGGDPAKLADVEAGLRALAAHPATARHIARKLAVHFAADTPPEALVLALERQFLAEEGALEPLYQTLATHPDMAATAGQKARQPFEFIAAGLRALGLSGEDVMALPARDLRGVMRVPMRVMGQRWIEPAGPDGWPEAAEDWITPQQLAARIEWAMRAPTRLKRGVTPEPVQMVQAAFSTPPEDLAKLVARAESRAEGLGLVFASAPFNRR